SGSYEIKPEDLLAPGELDAEEFRRGLRVAFEEKEDEPGATAAFRAGFERGRELRARNPEVRIALAGTTDADGLVSWPAPAWLPGYRYSVRAESREPYSRVETPYAPLGDRVLRALAYPDRPIYRPGDRVCFKAILRVRDGEGLALYDGQQALVEVRHDGRTIDARSLDVTEHGTVSGALELAPDSPRGRFELHVNGQEAGFFRVDDWRRPALEIVARHPRAVAAGETAVIEAQVRTWSGEPIPNTKVYVELGGAPHISRARDDDFEHREPRFLRLQSSRAKTDALGRFTVRFPT